MKIFPDDWTTRRKTIVISVIVVMALYGLSQIGSNDTADAEPRAARTTSRTAAPTATSTISDYERSYLTKIDNQTNDLQTSLNRFGELAQTFDYFDRDWRRDVALQLGIWKATYNEAKAMSPPARFKEFHTGYIASLRKIDSAADDVAKGLDNLDVDLINRATTKLLEARTLITDAVAQLPPLK